MGVQDFLHLLDNLRPVLDEVLADDFDFILAAYRSASLRIRVFNLAESFGSLIDRRLTLERCFDQSELVGSLLLIETLLVGLAVKLAVCESLLGCA